MDKKRIVKVTITGEVISALFFEQITSGDKEIKYQKPPDPLPIHYEPPETPSTYIAGVTGINGIGIS